MHTIQEWINDRLMDLGLISDVANKLDNSIILLIIILVTVAFDYICRYIVLGMFKRLAKRTKNQWDDLIVERKIINKMMHIIPAILVYILVPFAFPPEEFPKLLLFLQKICLIYIIAVSLRFINASLNIIHEIYNRKESFKDKPLKGFIQIIQVTVFFIGIIFIISILINKSPVSLFAGLGASAAILMLVFKDTILGFVAGIQLSANDMLRAGDWITMDKYGANGTVMEVTLNAVKVKNFDNTITTIPPYALVSDAFQNWRGMSESSGRRVKRSINIDMNSVCFCTAEMLDKFRKISLITDYIDGKEDELHKYNEEHHIDNSVWVNGRRQTNLGVFRAYLLRYLQSLPEVNKELTCMVRHLQPTETGIPIELYFFSSIKDWVPYEGVQADVFDHILAIIPEFGLSVFQNISGADLRSLKGSSF
ncbi:mechanosensitive ion channel family protein [Parabacteroides bouchesdurhonensis]|uniref:mechanosensitive ion channel family protein n=1 Tax=Parabacteroides bouchesdurhonensis TaxID=1936995 RepID=UPI000C842824|nr:mechanosensitive ion channel family protein [Parabacteroides bouchesdurhonensis]